MLSLGVVEEERRKKILKKKKPRRRRGRRLWMPWWRRRSASRSRRGPQDERRGSRMPMRRRGMWIPRTMLIPKQNMQPGEFFVHFPIRTLASSGPARLPSADANGFAQETPRAPAHNAPPRADRGQGEGAGGSGA